MDKELLLLCSLNIDLPESHTVYKSMYDIWSGLSPLVSMQMSMVKRISSDKHTVKNFSSGGLNVIPSGFGRSK